MNGLGASFSLWWDFYEFHPPPPFSQRSWRGEVEAEKAKKKGGGRRRKRRDGWRLQKGEGGEEEKRGIQHFLLRLNLFFSRSVPLPPPLPSWPSPPGGNRNFPRSRTRLFGSTRGAKRFFPSPPLVRPPSFPGDFFNIFDEGLSGFRSGRWKWRGGEGKHREGGESNGGREQDLLKRSVGRGRGMKFGCQRHDTGRVLNLKSRVPESAWLSFLGNTTGVQTNPRGLFPSRYAAASPEPFAMSIPEIDLLLSLFRQHLFRVSCV